MNPEVSVIIPAYNAEKYIFQSIESVLKQSKQNFEIIVVDDASVDNTVNIVNSFFDNRIKLLVNDYNRGVSYTRNRAIKEAKGYWIALLDSDDWYAEKRLEKLLSMAYKNNADLISDNLYMIESNEKLQFSWGNLFDREGDIKNMKLIDPIMFIKSNSNFPEQINERNLGLTKPVIKRNFIVKNNIKYDEKITVAEDFYFQFICLIKGARYILFTEPLYFYRTHQNSLVRSTKKPDRLNDIYKVIWNIKRQKIVQHNSELKQAVSYLLLSVQKQIDYYQIIQPLKKRQLNLFILRVLLKPSLLLRILIRNPSLLVKAYQKIINYQFTAFKKILN